MIVHHKSIEQFLGANWIQNEELLAEHEAILKNHWGIVSGRFRSAVPSLFF